jgi:hypothetical protein
VQTPFIAQKNEATALVSLGGLPYATNIDVQAAYNPVKHVTLMANYFRMYNKFSGSNLNETTEVNKLQYLEGGIGGWVPFEDEHLRLGVILGLGNGRVNNKYEAFRYTKLRYTRAFLQPTFIYLSEYFSFGFGTRLAHLSYKSGDIDASIPAEELDYLVQIEERNPFFLIESGINIGAHLKPVTWSLSIVRGGMSSSDNYTSYRFDLTNISMGLSLDLHGLKKKQKGKMPKLAPTDPTGNMPAPHDD